MGFNPNNIGMPFYDDDVAKLKKDEKGYSGEVRFDLHK